MARVLHPPHSDARMEELGERIRSGKLVSFPTETVYGLGANGYDRDAVLKIFTTKRRPLSDPVILHVADLAGALHCFSLGSERAVVEALAGAFWPGPLSIVAKAADHVPSEISAGTGFCSVRCPNHPLALALIKAARVPIAAPSANLFGHISPTTAEHVMRDFESDDVVVLQGLGNDCSVGIESTVVKVENNRVTILRRGGITLDQLQAAVDVPVVCPEITYAQKDIAVAQESPGQLLTHYAPRQPTYLVRVSEASQEKVEIDPTKCVLVDYAGRLQSSASWHHVLQLSVTEDPEEAARRLFALLREAEDLAGDRSICIADFDAQDQRAEALFDRIYRAASGKRLVLHKGCLYRS